MPLNDLRCDACKVVQSDVRYTGTPPNCPSCGSTRVVDWSHGQAPAVSGHGYGSFTPIDMGVLGKAETKEQFDRNMAVIKQRHPTSRVEFIPETRKQKTARIDEMRHKSFQRKMKAGLDAKTLEQGVAAMNRKVQEATNGALRANQDPSAAVKKLKSEGVKG